MRQGKVNCTLKDLVQIGLNTRMKEKQKGYEIQAITYKIE